MDIASEGRNTRGFELRAEHDKLVAEAKRRPGVADIVEVYGRLAPYAAHGVALKVPTRYATGGNG